MRSRQAEKLLKWLLILVGGMAASALFAVVMPTAWMETISLRLGLEPLPRTPLAQYLTRSLSLIYAQLGVLVIYVALDVRRYRPLIALVGALTALLGAALTALDFAIGMPASWSWVEGPPTILFGAAIVWLARRVHAEPAS